MKNHWLNKKKFRDLAEKIITNLKIECTSSEKIKYLADMIHIANAIPEKGIIAIKHSMAHYLLIRHALCQRKKSKRSIWKV
jgi:hypothetical protein